MKMKKQRVALVTGATRMAGIGAAIAKELAVDGVNIGIGYFRPYDNDFSWRGEADEPEQLLEQIRAMGRQAVGFEVDLSTSTGPGALLEQVQSTLGPVDILVNNAAYSTNTPLEEISAEAMDLHYAVNTRAMVLLCQAFAAQFDGSHGGRVINMSTGQGAGPMPNELAYVASKGAVEALTTSLVPVLMEKGITINAIDPGLTDTGWVGDELREEFLASSPSGRIGIPQDAARLACFLASDSAEWITGQVIRSRGGL